MLPVGAPVEPRPSGQRPARAVMAGSDVRLEPIDARAHAKSLFTLSHRGPEDAALWTYLPYGPFPDLGAFERWLDRCGESGDPLFFALVLRASGVAAGMASYLNIVPEMGRIEVGHIWFAPSLQKTRAASEAIFLMNRHAFEDLGYRRVEWKCDALNAGSRRAAERLGFTYEGTFRQHLIVKGRNRDTAWFSLLDHEWPRVRKGFERWLAPDNFDDHGHQRASLRSLRPSS